MAIKNDNNDNDWQYAFMTKFKFTVDSGRLLHLSNLAETDRHFVAGVEYAPMTICGLCTNGNEYGLLSPFKDSSTATVSKPQRIYGESQACCLVGYMNLLKGKLGVMRVVTSQ